MHACLPIVLSACGQLCCRPQQPSLLAFLAALLVALALWHYCPRSGKTARNLLQLPLVLPNLWLQLKPTLRPRCSFCLELLQARLYGRSSLIDLGVPAWLTILSDGAGVHCAGISQATRHLRKRGLPTDKLTSKITKIDIRYQLQCHVTAASSRDFLMEVSNVLGGNKGKVNNGRQIQRSQQSPTRRPEDDQQQQQQQPNQQQLPQVFLS